MPKRSEGWFAAQVRQTHWLLLLGAFAAAYLLNFYAGVYAEINRPPSLIVFLDHRAGA